MENSKSLKKIAKASLPVLKKNGVVKAGIFGSVARGEEKRKSDVDFLVKFKGQKSLLDLVRLERELKTRLKRKVDVVTYNSVNSYLKERIMKEEVRIL